MKTITRWTALALCLALLRAILPQMSLTAHAAAYSGSCGDNLSWSFDSDNGLLTIEGSGAMYDVGTTTTLWNAFCEQIVAVKLPDGLTSIGYGAFSSCSALKEITIPESVTKISAGAFSNCSALTTVKLPAGLKKIDRDKVFSNCHLKT